MYKKLVSFFLVVLLVGLTLLGAGCQKTPSTPAPSGQSLNLYDIDPMTLDPAVSGEATSHQYIMQLFSGLLRLDENLEPAPDIAERWQLSPDGKTYTFTLRKDVKFANGRQVKADDFKYSWERACNPATGSNTAATYLNDIVGVPDVLAGKANEISGIKVIDDYTLQVSIDGPKSYFLSKLTYPTSYVVDRDNVKTGALWWQKPNGTGPFTLKQWDKEKSLVLERNDLHYGEKARVKTVNYTLWSGLPMNLYETGKIDITGIGLTYIDKVTDKSGPFNQQLVIVPELSFNYIGFNLTQPPFDDVNIRRAFIQAIDKDKVISLVYRDMYQKADGILPPGMPGFNPSFSGLKFDVSAARKLIAASRYGDASKLPPITITTSGWGGLIPRQLEAVIQEWRNNLGVEVKVRQIEPERFLYSLNEELDEMFDIGWIADYPHPQDFLEVLFRTGVDNNYGGYSNAEVDALLQKAGMEQDEKTSLALYQQVEQKLVDNAACLPLWFGKNYVLVKPYVQGYKLNALGYYDLSSVSVASH